jgi:hypothetical protein
VILDYLRNQMPSMFGKEKKKKELLEELEKGLVFRTVMKQYNISVGDFPDLHKFKRDIEMLGERAYRCRTRMCRVYFLLFF